MYLEKFPDILIAPVVFKEEKPSIVISALLLATVTPPLTVVQGRHGDIGQILVGDECKITTHEGQVGCYDGGQVVAIKAESGVNVGQGRN